MMYRATETESIESNSFDDLCFATEDADALGYISGCNRTVDPCYLHTARVTDWDKIASWDEAIDAWRAAGHSVSADTDTPMCYADSSELRGVLAEAGFWGMTYEDEGPENAYMHDTIRVWDDRAWELVSTEQID